MWSVGVYDLGLTTEEWGRLTPREFRALCERWKQDQKRQDGRVALIAALIANANRDPKRRSKPYQVDDFMPKERKKQTAEQMRDTVKVLHAAFGGKGKRVKT